MCNALNAKSILVIDDSPSIRTFVRIMLHARGYNVLEAATAEQGLESFIAAHPDLVILDLGLPDYDGLELLFELRKQSDTPVIILTVRNDYENRREAQQKGANLYLTKPFRADELMEEADKLINATINSPSMPI